MTRKELKRRRDGYKASINVRFDGEVPRIGCGVRPVMICSIGPKWVYLYSPERDIKQKLPRSTWDFIALSNRLGHK